MATLIAIAVVAFIFWSAQQSQRRREAALPPPSEPVAVELPSPDTPRVLVPSAASPSSSPWAGSPTAPLPTRLETPTPYAFASQMPRRVDRSAQMMRLARGKGLCSPRQPPS